MFWVGFLLFVAISSLIDKNTMAVSTDMTGALAGAELLWRYWTLRTPYSLRILSDVNMCGTCCFGLEEEGGFGVQALVAEMEKEENGGLS